MIEPDADANTGLSPTPGEIADSPKNRSRAKIYTFKLNERLRLPDDVVAEIEAAFLKLINTTSLIERSWFRESSETAKAIEGLYTEAESKRHPVSELVKLVIPRIEASARKQAFDEAARAVCRGCNEGDGTTLGNDGEVWHLKGAGKCRAVEIRALTTASSVTA